MTNGEAYGPAMEIEDQAAADAYFEILVEHAMQNGGLSRDAAVDQERSNLGYYAGYYDNATRSRVEKLYHCSHPVFGAIDDVGPVSPETAFELGQEAGKVSDKLSLDITAIENKSSIRFNHPDGSSLEIAGTMDFVNETIEEILSNCPKVLTKLREACDGITEEDFREKFNKALASVTKEAA